tara:strand:+ start:500 stop:2566 length:2067 start_codon:yes stop_codon:yes gene_type:complete
MVDKIDPTNQTSVEYGQSLLERKIAQDEKFAKEARKDSRINYAFQVLGGVDELIKNRYERNIAERNAGFDQDIIRERAEFNKLQKIYDDQSEWRKYEEMGPTAVYGYARMLANNDLTAMYGETIPVDDQIKKDYDKDLKRITNQYYDNYKNNKITMPFETVEEYTADLQALKNKRVPSGLLDTILTKTGIREDSRAALETEISTRRASYADRLAERKGVKGSPDNLTEEDKARLLRTPDPVTSTEEYQTTVKNGLGQEVTAIGIKTKVGNDTKITGFRFPGSNKVVSTIQLYGSTKQGAEMLYNQAESKIRKMEGMVDATKRQIQNYIFENPQQFPDLKSEMYTHDLVLPRIKAFDSNEEDFKNIAAGAVSNIRKNPDHPNYQAVDIMTDKQRGALATGILESMKAINDYGRINQDGTVTYLTNTSDIVSLATSEQLNGVSFAGRGIRDDVAIYNMVTPRSVPFDNLAPEDGDTDDTLKSKGTVVINKLIESQRFIDSDYSERRAYVNKVEELYKTEFDVPSELLNAPPTPIVDEVGNEDVSDNRTIDDQLDDLEFIKTAYSPSNIQEELEQGNPVFLGDYRNVSNDSRSSNNTVDVSSMSSDELEDYATTGGERAFSRSNIFKRQQVRQQLKTLERYADGVLSKNRKPSPRSSVGKALNEFNLEKMSRSEIKEWLSQNTVDSLAPKQ